MIEPGKSESARGGNSSTLASHLLLRLYAVIRGKGARSLLRSLVLRLEGGPVYSLTIREIFRRFHGVDVGLYTVGPCEVEPGNLPPGTVVGRYSSIYWTSRALAHDGPVVINPQDGNLNGPAPTGVPNGTPPATRLTIGNDVFVGHNVIVLPTVTQIGDGVFIGAGSVLHANVPPYAIVTGNPGRVVRYRFSPATIKQLLESQWWLKSIEELGPGLEEFRKPLEGAVVR